MLHGRTELAGPCLPDLLHACESGSVELFGPVHTSIVKSTKAFAIQYQVIATSIARGNLEARTPGNSRSGRSSGLAQEERLLDDWMNFFCTVSS